MVVVVILATLLLGALIAYYYLKSSDKKQLPQEVGNNVKNTPSKTLHIIYATESGTTRKISHKLSAELSQQQSSENSFNVKVLNCTEVEVDHIATYSHVVFVVSTYQGGVPPPSAEGFATMLSDYSMDFRVSTDAWKNVRYAVLGCGSKNYGANYNVFAKNVFEWMKRKEAVPMFDVVLSDETTTANDVRAFLQNLRSALGQSAPPPPTRQQQPTKKAKPSHEEDDVDEDDLDIEELVASGEPTDELITGRIRGALTKQGYSLFGTHSGVKLCRWTKSMIRGRGGCYKHTFYGISSLSCMEMTPSLACANKCVFCWRHHTNPTTREWKWKHDTPEFLLEQALEKHRTMVRVLRGVPGVTPEKIAEAERVKHCALSLVGEPILYPEINRLCDLMHRNQISSFMVTNAQFPDRIEQLGPVTQLYLSVDAGNAQSLKAVDRPIFEDFWERYLDCIQKLALKKQRTVFRLTLVKKFNTTELDDYAKLILMGHPDFIEIKGMTFCGDSGGSSALTMENVPFHEEVVAFCNEIIARVGERYAIACEHEHSCCMLLAKHEFRDKETGEWYTWIDYEKFFELATSGKPFTSMDYRAKTPNWAVFGAEEKGFDPLETRHRRKEKGPKLGGC
eukprot:PhF_6_TR40200/c0_g1_i1/m.59656/K15449/TYW1; tRNA wybutosine-synthesizing protein 1